MRTVQTIAAQVGTQTANIRVLSVGDGSLSYLVAGQLDVCEPWQLDPLGRIRLLEGEQAIGRHRTTGELVRAYPHWCVGMAGCHGSETSRQFVDTSVELPATVRGIRPLGSYSELLEDWQLVTITGPESAGGLNGQTCRCCAGCSVVLSGWRKVSSYIYGIEVGADGTCHGRIGVHPVYQHLGSGNQFGPAWLAELPLIILT